MRQAFRRIAAACASAIGSPWAFLLAVGLCIVWAVAGPFFNYSDTWQLVINTSTTVLTFLAVFLIQNTQNRDSHAIHLKLDEIIRSIDPARNELIDIEEEADKDMEKFEDEFRTLRSKLRKNLKDDET